MEPVTHLLTGACLARTGLNRRAAYTTLVMTIAAEFPDIDTLWSLRGPVAGFQHHRGITHTLVGIPVEAAFLVAMAFGLHRIRLARAVKPDEGSARLKPLTVAPVRWGTLYGFALLALGSHLLLDYTNNYGLRPFFPFNPRWYAGAITFIFDPWMFALLLFALVLPPLFRLIGAEVGAKRKPFAARGWAFAALLGVAGLWGWRTVERSRAIALAESQSLQAAPATQPEATSAEIEEPPIPAPLVNAQGDMAHEAGPAPETAAPIYLQPQRVLANPDPLSPFRWWVVTDFGPVYQLAEVQTRNGVVLPAQQTQPKLPPNPALAAAQQSALGRAYLDWSPMPFITITHPAPGESAGDDLPAAHTLVTFRDPRFLGQVPGMRSRVPLEGQVELDEANRIVRQTMDGKEQK